MWYNTFASFFKEHKFVFFNVDFSVFFNKKLIIVIYVDDILLIKFNSEHIVVVKHVFNKRFKMIDLNSFRFYLNMNIERNRSNRILFFNQKIYLKKIFKNHDMWKCKSVATFMNTSWIWEYLSIELRAIQKASNRYVHVQFRNHSRHAQIVNLLVNSLEHFKSCSRTRFQSMLNL